MLGLLLTVFFAVPAAAFDFSQAGTEIVLPAETSAISIWVSVPAQRGDTVSNYCYKFLRERAALDIISTYQCSKTAMDVNGFVSWNDFKSIQIGQLVMLPSPKNDAAVMRARAPALGPNPMGLASEIRRLAIADDEITARLVVLETSQLSPANVQVLINTAVQAGATAGVDPLVFDAAIAALNIRIDSLGGVTANEVSQMLSTTMQNAGLSQTKVLQAIDEGMMSLDSRLKAVERGQLLTNEAVNAVTNRTAAVELALDGKVNTTDLAEEIKAVNDRINGLPEATSGLTVDEVTQLVDVRVKQLDTWFYGILGVSLLALALGLFLWWNKLSKKAATGEMEAIDAKVTGRIDEEVKSFKNAVSEAQTATEAAIKAVAKLTDRVRDVEEVQVLFLTLDSQGRFSCPELSDTRLKELGNTEQLTLEIVCRDNRARKVHVTKGVGGDGNPRLNFHGLEKGHDFVDSISLVSLYRHLVKARQNEWIIGLTAANKAA